MNRAFSVMRNLLAKQPTIHQPIYLANPVFHPPISILHPFLSLNVPSSHPTPEPASGHCCCLCYPGPSSTPKVCSHHSLHFNLLSAERWFSSAREKEHAQTVLRFQKNPPLLPSIEICTYILKNILSIFSNIISSFLRFSLRLIFKLANQVINRHFLIFLSIYSFFLFLFYFISIKSNRTRSSSHFSPP